MTNNFEKYLDQLALSSEPIDKQAFKQQANTFIQELLNLSPFDIKNCRNNDEVTALFTVQLAIIDKEKARLVAKYNANLAIQMQLNDTFPSVLKDIFTALSLQAIASQALNSTSVSPKKTSPTQTNQVQANQVQANQEQESMEQKAKNLLNTIKIASNSPVHDENSAYPELSPLNTTALNGNSADTKQLTAKLKEINISLNSSLENMFAIVKVQEPHLMALNSAKTPASDLSSETTKLAEHRQLFANLKSLSVKLEAWQQHKKSKTIELTNAQRELEEINKQQVALATVMLNRKQQIDAKTARNLELKQLIRNHQTAVTEQKRVDTAAREKLEKSLAAAKVATTEPKQLCEAALTAHSNAVTAAKNKKRWGRLFSCLTLGIGFGYYYLKARKITNVPADFSRKNHVLEQIGNWCYRNKATVLDTQTALTTAQHAQSAAEEAVSTIERQISGLETNAAILAAAQAAEQANQKNIDEQAPLDNEISILETAQKADSLNAIKKSTEIETKFVAIQQLTTVISEISAVVSELELIDAAKNAYLVHPAIRLQTEIAQAVRNSTAPAAANNDSNILRMFNMGKTRTSIDLDPKTAVVATTTADATTTASAAASTEKTGARIKNMLNSMLNRK